MAQPARGRPSLVLLRLRSLWRGKELICVTGSQSRELIALQSQDGDSAERRQDSVHTATLKLKAVLLLAAVARCH